MTAAPPARRLHPAVAYLAAACVVVACGSTSAMPSGAPPIMPPAGAGTPVVAGTSVAPGPDMPPMAGLLVLDDGRLWLGASDGSVRRLDGPGGPIERVTSARGTVVAQTPGSSFHLAVIDVDSTSEPDWSPLDIDPGIAERPLSAMALSPDATRIALLAADFGSGQPFEAVVVDVATSRALVLPVDREPNGPPQWLDPSTVLLETAASAAGGPFVRLDAATGTVTQTNAAGYGPSLTGDGAIAAVVDGPAVRILPAAKWLAGAPLDSADSIEAQEPVLHVAIDPTGGRLALGLEGHNGNPSSLQVFVSDPPAWSRAAVAELSPTWIGWLR